MATVFPMVSSMLEIEAILSDRCLKLPYGGYGGERVSKALKPRGYGKMDCWPFIFLFFPRKLSSRHTYCWSLYHAS